MKKRDGRKIGSGAQYELRLRAISLRKKGHTQDEVANLLEVSKSAVRKWCRLHEQGGARALRLGKRGRQRGACRTLDVDMERKVKGMIVDKNPEQLKMPFALWTRQAVQELIGRECGIVMPIRSVGEYLRRWGFTPQRPRKRAYEQQPAAIKEWLRNTYPGIACRAKDEHAEIQWCDETGLSSEDHRGRGYAPQGHTPVAGTQAARFSASMISTVTNRGKLRFMVYRKGLKVPTFILFLQRLIRDADAKVFLILDNLRVHHARKVREWVEKNHEKIELFFLPPYCPEINPDEYLNNTIKAQLRRKPAPRSHEQLQQDLRNRMKSNQKKPHLIKKLFEHPAVRYAAA
jgi:transposase